MARQIFELQSDELRAVIGGAIYYSAFNRLPTAPVLDAFGKLPVAPAASDRLGSR